MDLDLTKEVRGNEPPAETKRKVAKERRKADELSEKNGEGGGRERETKKETESEEGVRVRSREEHDDAEKGNDERKVKEKAGKVKE